MIRFRLQIVCICPPICIAEYHVGIGKTKEGGKMDSSMQIAPFHVAFCKCIGAQNAYISETPFQKNLNEIRSILFFFPFVVPPNFSKKSAWTVNWAIVSEGKEDDKFKLNPPGQKFSYDDLKSEMT